MITIKEAHQRSKLIEGRNYGMGFAFVKKIKKDTYETVHAVSACKDYLNDIVAAEHMNVEASACGLVYKPQGLFKDGEAYLTFKILPYFNGKEYAEQKKDTEILETLYENIEKEVHDLEEALKIKGRTKIEKAKNGYYLATIPIEWTSSTYLISLLSLWIRVCQYNRSKPTTNLGTYLSISPIDSQLWTNALPKIKLIMDKGKLPVQNFLRYGSSNAGAWHGYGILNYAG